MLMSEYVSESVRAVLVNLPTVVIGGITLSGYIFFLTPITRPMKVFATKGHTKVTGYWQLIVIMKKYVLVI